MERYLFIHGSSDGQTFLMPEGVPLAVCERIANDYFRGRTLRIENSKANVALVVELLEDNYCTYTFLHNNCLGANGGRIGQYFAITALCNSEYLFPEKVLYTLNTGFETLMQHEEVIHVNNEGLVQYVISQLGEKRDYLLQFIDSFTAYFNTEIGGCFRPLQKDICSADFSSWKGEIVLLDNSNSQSSYEKLCTTGRLYISDEYETPSEQIETLGEKVRQAEIKIQSLQSKLEQSQSGNAEKENDRIKALEKDVDDLNRENDSLKKKNNELQSDFATVSGILLKHEEATKKATNPKNVLNDILPRNKKDILRMILQYIVLILVTIICILNIIYFFRTLSPTLREEEGEMETTSTATVADINKPKSQNQFWYEWQRLYYKYFCDQIQVVDTIGSNK